MDAKAKDCSCEAAMGSTQSDAVDVLIVHNILWSHYKGAVFTEVNKQGLAQGVAVKFVHIANVERDREGLGGVDLSVHQYPFEVLFQQSYESVPFLRKAYSLLRILFRHRPRVVLLPGYFDASFWILAIASRAMRCQIVLAFDSQETDKERGRFRELLKKLFIRMCDMGFTYGKKSKEYLQSLGMAPDRIIVRVQATMNDEISQLHLRALTRRPETQAELKLKNRNFVYVGRLSAEKNVAALLRAFACAVSTVSAEQRWGLLIVGNGRLRRELESQCKDLGLEDVVFTGGKSWREVPEFLALGDVLVLPSLSEPWGLVVNEAMACGMPVLVSDKCGAAHDLVEHGRNGFMYAGASQSELEKYLRMFMEAPAERISTMGKQSRKIIAAFSPVTAAGQMLTGFTALLGRRPSIFRQHSD